jgi:hypothetical protein
MLQQFFASFHERQALARSLTSRGGVIAARLNSRADATLPRGLVV